MQHSMKLALAITGLLGATHASAVNPAFQDLLFAACQNPNGALAARCKTTFAH